MIEEENKAILHLVTTAGHERWLTINDEIITFIMPEEDATLVRVTAESTLYRVGYAPEWAGEIATGTLIYEIMEGKGAGGDTDGFVMAGDALAWYLQFEGIDALKQLVAAR